MRQIVKDKIVSSTNNYYEVTNRIGYPTKKSEYATIGFEKGSKQWAEQCEKLYEILSDILDGDLHIKRILAIRDAKIIRSEYEEWLSSDVPS